MQFATHPTITLATAKLELLQMQGTLITQIKSRHYTANSPVGLSRAAVHEIVAEARRLAGEDPRVQAFGKTLDQIERAEAGELPADAVELIMSRDLPEIREAFRTSLKS